MQLAILGRQAKLSLAEIESLFGAENVRQVSEYVAAVQSDSPLPQPRLGGTMKSARIITTLKNADANQAFAHIQDMIIEYTDEKVFDGKIQLGFSLYGFKAQKNWLLKKSLEVKKVLKKSGRSVRIIENKSEALEAAQILYNKLTGPQGIELLIIKDGADVILAQTTAVQDIDAYAQRDFGRPMRDAFVGMLPPKLAQIMINLAVQDTDPSHDGIVLDPFCGTGVVLQEATLMGFDVYGSDISDRMVEYTDHNLVWLQQTGLTQMRSTKSDDGKYFQSEVGDATTHRWSPVPQFVVCETYLGQPLTSLPDQKSLTKIMRESNDITADFLQNIAPQLKRGTRLCIAVPAWYADNLNSEFLHLDILDRVTDLGYNRIDLKHATKADLIYHRPDQVVARELILLEKK